MPKLLDEPDLDSYFDEIPQAYIDEEAEEDDQDDVDDGSQDLRQIPGGASANPLGIQMSVLDPVDAKREFEKPDESSDENLQDAQNLLDDLETSMESLNVSKDDIDIKEEPVEFEKQKFPPDGSTPEASTSSASLENTNVEENENEKNVDEGSFELKWSGSDTDNNETAK